MMDQYEAKSRVLQDLMDKMREMDGGRLKPKAVEVSVSSLKPEVEPSEMHGAEGGESEPVLEGKTDDVQGEHAEPDGDELSPEDLKILEQLFAGKEDEAC